jgi:hypothetical protein
MPAEPVSPIEKVASDGKIALDPRKLIPAVTMGIAKTKMLV